MSIRPFHHVPEPVDVRSRLTLPGEVRSRLTLRAVTDPLSALAFWTAIALPAFYIPIALTGIDSAGELGIFLGLFATHLFALAAGRSYRRS